MKTERPRPAVAKVKAKPAAKRPGKVFDVQKPGKAPASPTSRPVIVGHKPEVQDSILGVGGIGDPRPAPLPVPAKHKIELRVLSNLKKITEEAAPTASQNKSTADQIPSTQAPPKLEPVEAKQVAAIVTRPEDIQVTPSEPAVPPPAPAPASAPQEQPALPPKPRPTPPPAPDPPQDAVPVEASSEYSIDDIIVSHHHHTSPGKFLALLLLVIILAALVLDILLDAELLQINGLPHTDFF